MNRALVIGVVSAGVLVTSAWVVLRALPKALLLSRYPELPDRVATDLARRGCSVVPDRVRRGGRNVLRGEFTRAGQTDWAVLCRQGDQASLIVYPAGNPGDAVVLKTSASGLGENPEEARTIGVVQPDRLQMYARRRAMPPGVPEAKVDFEHAGIEDAIGMGSTVLYYSNGQWLRMPGAD